MYTIMTISPEGVGLWGVFDSRENAIEKAESERWQGQSWYIVEIENI